MSHNKEAEFTLKAVINKDGTKVLLAEIDRNFADVLLSFLTLPLGTIITVLKKQYGDQVKIGSLTSLYNGLSNLDSVHFLTEGCKMMLLNPRSSFEAEYRKLKLDINDTKPNKYFVCQDWDCFYPSYDNISMYYDIVTCCCGQPIARELDIFNSKPGDDNVDVDDDYVGGVFTRNSAYFLISDDLQMVPSVEGSIMETLGILGIADMDGAELKNVTFGFDEVMDLLKQSLLYSSTPLSDIILRETKIDISRKHSPKRNDTEKEATTSNYKKMIVKVMVQKSTNKVLFAQAENDFIGFLFSLLTIPLGGVENLLGGKTCLENIDNLYMSLKNINGDRYLRTRDTKSRLINPKLPHGYMSKNQILPLTEEIAPTLYYHQDLALGTEWISGCSSYDGEDDAPAIEFLEGPENYVNAQGPTMYMVTDDLTVTPLCMYSTLSILKELKVPLSDAKEVEVHVGLQEGLNILKASLTSTSALTDGLMISPMLRINEKDDDHQLVA